MTISVVIPAYNEEQLLPKTISALLELDRKPDEILIVNGGSTDQTVAIAEHMGTRVITVAHRGIGFARQQGVLAAKGDIVAFTDADTVVPKHWLTTIEQTLQKPNVSGVFGSFRVTDGKPFYRFLINIYQPILNQILYWFGIYMAAGQNIAFIKTKAIEAGGFPAEYKIAEDVEMAHRLKKVGHVVYLPRLIVTSSGRRGDEGLGFILRGAKAFFIYFVLHRGDKVGFPDIR